MATGSLYGSVSESTGLYGIGAASGGTYFEWFIFQDSLTAPATPTGGSWSFSTNIGTPPTGWVVSPPPAPVNQVWVSIAVVDTRSPNTFTWSVPGLMASSGLPILSASGVPSAGTGSNGQLYINTATTPQGLYFKQSGAWTQLTGSNFVDLINNQTIGGVKTFTETIQGSISGTAANVTGTVAVANGGTGATTASDARTNLGLGTIATQSASAVAITGGSITGITDLAIADGGTGASTAAQARVNLDAVGLSDTQTLTNKTINAADNTLSNIPNSALSNSSVTINGTPVSLGTAIAVTAETPNELVFSTGLSATSNFDGSQETTVSLESVGTAGVYGSAGTTPQITVNTVGQVTDIIPLDIVITTNNVSGSIAIAQGGTGASAAKFAMQNLLPDYAGNNGKSLVLAANGTDLEWKSVAGVGTVTSIDGSGGTTGLTLTGGPITAAGTLTLGGTLAIDSGGTGAVNAADARTNLGLGTISTQDSSSVSITGGSITGITDLAIADGGTGASNAADARTNLGLGTAAVLNAGVALGVATLDGGGTVPTSQLPAAVLGAVKYQGTWNASTNTPTLTSSVGSQGHYYVVNVAGSTDLNGITDWLVGDWAIYNGSIWEKIDNTDAVTSVNGYTGTVVLTNTDISGFGTMSTQNANAVAITGGSINGTTIGATTASTVTGTTVTATTLVVNDNTTLGSSNSDTVNFNARVNSDIDPSTNNAYDLGRNAHAWRNLYLTGTANIADLTASGDLTLSGGTANGVAYLNGSKVLTTGSALTFDGTNLGVGATPTSYNASADNLVLFSSVNTGLTVASGTSNDGSIFFARGTSGSDAFRGYIQYYHASDNLAFGVNASEQMRLTSTGLGIGTSSPGYKIHASTGSAQSVAGLFQSGSTLATVAFKGTSTSSDFSVRIGTDGSDALVGYTGNTERARIDSSGNLGLGVTPSAWATLKGLQVLNANMAGLGNKAYFSANAFFSGSSWVYQASDFANLYIQQDGQHQWNTAPSGTAGDAISFTQAMTLDASGNLGVGTTSPAQRLHIAGNAQVKPATGTDAVWNRASNDSGEFYLGIDNSAGAGFTGTAYARFLYSTGAYPLNFYTNGAERARIDSSGNLLVGQTSAGASNSDSLCFNGPASGGSVVVNHVNGSASGSGYAFFAYNAGVIGSITQSGTTAVLYNVTSDQRLKENIQDAAPASALIDALQVRQYDWKADGNHQRYGFVAQELVTVAPEAVHQPADPEEMMAVDYSKLVPMLVKEIQSLRARVAALESN